MRTFLVVTIIFLSTGLLLADTSLEGGKFTRWLGPDGNTFVISDDKQIQSVITEKSNILANVKTSCSQRISELQKEIDILKTDSESVKENVRLYNLSIDKKIYN